MLLASVLATAALSGCGAPAYTYVADSAAGTYYKVPTQWHQIPQQSLSKQITAAGGSPTGVWFTAFDGNASPSATDGNSLTLTQPYVYSQVMQLDQTSSSGLSYDSMRDSWLPVTSSGRQTAASEGFLGTNFVQLRDQTIAGKQGVHGVRETFDYTFGTQTDTFDDEVLTNADQTEVYFVQVHCTQACYSTNQKNIDTIMSSFTVGSPT
jgi:hypothetical protein